MTFSPEFWRETIGALMMPPIVASGQATVGKAARYRWSTFAGQPPALHIGRRGAAVGDTLARILRFAGYDVDGILYQLTLAARCGSLAFIYCVPRNLPE